MKRIFVNIKENRLKAGWRILIFLFFFWVLSAISLVIKPIFGELTKKEFLQDYSLVIVAILAAAASITVPVSRRLLDHRSVKSLGLIVSKRTWKDLIFGFILSGLMAGIFLLITLQFNIVDFHGYNFNSLKEAINQSSGFVDFIRIFSLGALFIFLLEHIFVGYWEELVFRGYLFQNMSEGMGRKPAIIISCLLYGLIHYANPNAGLISSSIIILFGFLRIYGYLATGMLWLSMGMHIGWNFFQGPIFGFSASGHKKAALLSLEINNPNWLSGGSFGPEGSVIIIPIIVMCIGIMYVWGKKSKKIYSESGSLIQQLK